VANNELRGGNYNSKATNIITAYLAACILYGNGQRSGVITGLRIEEFLKRESSDLDTEKVIIPCLHHKTGAQGIARLVVTRNIEALLTDYYANIRKRIQPKKFFHTNRFFLTSTGALYTQVYRRITEALSVGKLKPPRPNEHRIVQTTEAARQLNDTDLSRVAKHLSHSSETSRKYYEYTNTNDAVLAHQALSNISQRRKWSKEHTVALLKEWPLTRNPPGLPACRYISKKHHMDRTGKQVLDKWRQLKLIYT